jgi:hypothetical protein
LFVLANLWADRMEWFFGIDMAVYHTTGVDPRVPVVPDAFLSLFAGGVGITSQTLASAC